MLSIYLFISFNTETMTPEAVIWEAKRSETSQP